MKISRPFFPERAFNTSMKSLLLVAMLTLFVTACTIGNPNVQQGNVLTSQQTSQLKLGMSKMQVASILGDPVLNNPFINNEWQYVHLYRDKPGHITKQQLVLTFSGDRLANIAER